MVIYLGILLFALTIFVAATIPFIDLLYRLKFTYRKPISPSTVLEKATFRQLQKTQTFKYGTPIGGGILIITLVSLLFPIVYPTLSHLGLYIHSSFPIKEELNIIFFTFISFGLLGAYNDFVKNWPARSYYKFALSLFCGFLLYFNLGISSFYIPYIGVIHLGFWYPLFAGSLIYIFSRAYNISDGLDGLAAGNLMISLFALWVLSVSALDTPISIFIALWLSGIITFLYFNIYPARIWLGNVGALSFGATLAVLGLLLGNIASLLIIGGVFLLEFFSWVIQVFHVSVFKKKIFSISPLHYWLVSHGWPEPKVVMRSWLLGILLAFVGLWLS